MFVHIPEAGYVSYTGILVTSRVDPGSMLGSERDNTAFIKSSSS